MKSVVDGGVCRKGLGQPATDPTMCELVRARRPSIVLLFETLSYVDCVGRSGGLTVLWNNTADCYIVTLVPNRGSRHLGWNLLRHIANIHFTGYQYTWFRGRGTVNAVEEKLDRTMGNLCWHDWFSRAILCEAWHRPCMEFIKLNVDASFFADSHQMSVGMVGETMCIFEALSWAKNLNLEKVVVEDDAKIVVDAVTSRVLNFAIFLDYVGACRLILDSEPFYPVSFVKRGANSWAHAFSRNSLLYENSHI
ncbi:hypothetical protein ACS0TY_016502 [Phlomoides rotata]